MLGDYEEAMKEISAGSNINEDFLAVALIRSQDHLCS